MHLLVWYAITLALYLFPTLVFVVLRRRPQRPSWALGFDLATGVAVDLLGVLLLTLFVPLQRAAFASRFVWLGVLGVAAVRRWRSRGEPVVRASERDPVALRYAAFAALSTLLLLAYRSLQTAMWDRQWHVPLVSVLRIQTLPFQNVFEPKQALPYHFAGDVVAAVLQTLSYGRFHASLALAAAHDVLLALTALVVALVIGGFARRRRLAMLGGAAAVLLAGPATLLLGDAAPEGAGFSAFSLLMISYRPHVPVALLMLAGLVGAIVVRAKIPELPSRATTPVMLACASVLAISDEASLALVGASLGLTWLVFPAIVWPTRLGGGLVFAALAVAFALPNTLFQAALSSGAQAQVITVVPWYVPSGVLAPVVGLSAATVGHLVFDYGALVVLLGLLGWLACAHRTRGAGPVALWLAAMTVLALFILTKIQVNGRNDESHRFVTVLFAAIPYAVMLFVDALPTASLAHAPLFLVLGVPAASSVDWYARMPGRAAHRVSALSDLGGPTIHEARCVEITGPRFKGAARRPYIDPSVYYLYAGCHPTFYPASTYVTHWTIRLGAELGPRALRLVDAATPADEALTLICPVADSSDRVCAWAKSRDNLCAGQGTDILRCTVPADTRKQIPR